ncbi:hypothetical protein POTOM_015514 [Populus tomentosa]|uniref:Uncharacterized protein n=2 Tax=Populus TaxID=3689 RepID=A0A8X8A017_POPTO|nr:hypothetical protein POTOM_015514 [Populus tomentosa]
MKPKSKTHTESKNSNFVWKWNTNGRKKKNGNQFPVPEFLQDNYKKLEETIMDPGGGVGIGCGIGAGFGLVGGVGIKIRERKGFRDVCITRNFSHFTEASAKHETAQTLISGNCKELRSPMSRIQHEMLHAHLRIQWISSRVLGTGYAVDMQYALKHQPNCHSSLQAFSTQALEASKQALKFLASHLTIFMITV